MKPYPFAPTDADFRMPTSAEIAEADERHDIARANRWAGVLVALTLVPLIVALAVHLYFRG